MRLPLLPFSPSRAPRRMQWLSTRKSATLCRHIVCAHVVDESVPIISRCDGSSSGSKEEVLTKGKYWLQTWQHDRENDRTRSHQWLKDASDARITCSHIRESDTLSHDGYTRYKARRIDRIATRRAAVFTRSKPLSHFATRFEIPERTFSWWRHRRRSTPLRCAVFTRQASLAALNCRVVHGLPRLVSSEEIPSEIMNETMRTVARCHGHEWIAITPTTSRFASLRIFGCELRSRSSSFYSSLWVFPSSHVCMHQRRSHNRIIYNFQKLWYKQHMNLIY